MVYMLHHEKEENLRLTAQLVKEAHAQGIAMEAEPGRIEGGEDGLADTVDLKKLLTDERRYSLLKTLVYNFWLLLLEIYKACTERGEFVWTSIGQ